MDGFYVCKIQKLSDKIPGESKNAENEEKVAQEVEEKATDKPKVETKKSKGPQKGRKDKKKGKKRTFNGEAAEKSKGGGKISVPPTQPKQKKKKLNAKMSKPRRLRVDQIT